MGKLKLSNNLEVDKNILNCIASLEEQGYNALGSTFVFGSNPVVINHNHVSSYASLSDKKFTKTFEGGYAKKRRTSK